LLRRSALGVAGLGLIGLVTGCGSGDGGDDEAPVTGLIEVAVRDNDFEPAAIEVPVGTTVTWRWDGDNAHNVVGDDFESETQTSGTFAHAFAAPGRYDYRCTLHGGMRGEVVVAERPSS
jgi:plastocyanin